MALLEVTILLTLVSAIGCQIVFPTRRPIVTEPVTRGPTTPSLDNCIASNGQPGTCYEFQSTQFKQCPFFPSTDTSNPDVGRHLGKNICRNTGGTFYFCCPNNSSVPTPSPTPHGMKECPMPCGDPSKGCLRPDVIPCEDECGNPNSFNVVGGEVSARNQWPWLAAIGRFIGGRFEPFCGGTLITKQHVITAAHCFNILPHIRVIVRLGEYNIHETSDIDGALDFSIVDRRVGDYNAVTSENDIILLKLDRPLNAFTENIKPACLPYHLRNENFEGDSPVVVGWGIFDLADARVSSVPLHAQVPVVPIPECQQRYINEGSTESVDNRQLCAGTGIQDSCKGDSGGPLNYIDLLRSRFYVIGLVSFGPRQCGSQRLPGVYTRIGHYLDWIDQNIRQLL